MCRREVCLSAINIMNRSTYKPVIKADVLIKTSVKMTLKENEIILLIFIPLELRASQCNLFQIVVISLN